MSTAGEVGTGDPRRVGVVVGEAGSATEDPRRGGPVGDGDTGLVVVDRDSVAGGFACASGAVGGQSEAHPPDFPTAAETGSTSCYALIPPCIKSH